MVSARAIDTGMEGFRLWPGALSVTAQSALLAEVLAAVEQSSFFRPVTPGGRPFSVEMTNLGPLGWVSDRAGYRYQPLHPDTGQPWPAIPGVLLALWRTVSGYSHDPEACLVNFYSGGARMGLHRDEDEDDFTAPVLSVSLGDTAIFRIGGPERGGKTGTLKLNSGDVLVMGGPSRLCYHGIDRVLTGSSTLLKDGGRINLTLRRVTRP